MTVVFISGSRTIPHLPSEVQGRIDNMVDNGLHIVVGDSERGVDSKVLSYLYDRGYPNVSIYSIHPRSRIGRLLPDWSLEQIAPDIPARQDKNGNATNRRELETYKDRAMCDVCNFALVIWQDTYTNPRFGQTSVSAGSLRNAVQLLLAGKPVTMYHRSEGDMLEEDFTHCGLRSISALEEFVKSLDGIVQARFSKMVKDESKLARDAAAMEQQHLDL